LRFHAICKVFPPLCRSALASAISFFGSSTVSWICAVLPGRWQAILDRPRLLRCSVGLFGQGERGPASASRVNCSLMCSVDTVPHPSARAHRQQASGHPNTRTGPPPLAQGRLLRERRGGENSAGLFSLIAICEANRVITTTSSTCSFARGCTLRRGSMS
jgi:hypothetical protein